MAAILFALARVALSAPFIIAGLGMLMNVTGIAGVLAAKAVPQAMLFGYVLGALQLAAGVLLLAGWKTRTAAWLLIVLAAAMVFIAHDFWTMSGAARALNQTQALKNFAIVGGLLLLALIGPGRYSVDAARGNR